MCIDYIMPSGLIFWNFMVFIANNINNNNNNNNNLFLIRRKLKSEFDQMRLTNKTTCNNYNKVYLRIPKNL